MAPKILVLATVACIGLAACGPKPTVDPAQTASADAPAAAAADSTFSVTPSSLSDCAQRVVAAVKWDVRSTHAGVAAVQIFAGTQAQSTLFAEGGNYGEVQTGPWTGSGSTFVLKDKANGQEIGRIAVAGPACQ